jgi:hypothetical protein
MKRVRKYYTAEVKHDYSGSAWHRLEDIELKNVKKLSTPKLYMKK